MRVATKEELRGGGLYGITKLREEARWLEEQAKVKAEEAKVYHKRSMLMQAVAAMLEVQSDKGREDWSL